MAAPDSSVNTWGIVPAAGMSRRMGRPKQLLSFRGSTMTAAVTRTLLDGDLNGVVVVTRTQLVDELRLPADPRLHVAINDDADSAMVDSIRIGLSMLDQFQPRPHDGVLVVPSDMPNVSTDSCRVCVAAFVSRPDRIVIATHQGRRGHPIVFPFSMREIINDLEGGLNMLPRACPERVYLVDVEDPGVEVDIDTTEDYKRL